MSFTKKEIRIILLLAKGQSTIDICEELGIKPHTVANHRKRIMSKSPYRNWCHFMAETGRKGFLSRWENWLELHDRPTNYGHEEDRMN